MDPDLQAFVARAADSRFIPSIYNYCDLRCRRCRFTDRCLTFQEEKRSSAMSDPSRTMDILHDSFQKTIELLQAWCDREGVDFGAIMKEAESPECTAEMDRVTTTVHADPLQRMAFAYVTAADAVVQALHRAAYFQAWERDVHDAIETIGSLSSLVASKIGRALSQVLFSEHEDFEDPVQNDWNGSAKIGRLIVAESKEAWRIVLEAGEAPPEAPIRQVLALLDRIDQDLDTRFPRAMDFIRPGFDQPAMASSVSGHLPISNDGTAT